VSISFKKTRRTKPKSSVDPKKLLAKYFPTLSGRTQRVPVGIEITPRRVRAVVLRAGATAPEVTHLIDVPLAPGVVATDNIYDEEGLADEMRGIVKRAKLQGASATLAVGGSDVFVKRVPLKRGLKHEVLRQLPQNPTLGLSNFDASATALDFESLDPDGTSDTGPALVVAARKDAIRVRQRIAVEAGLAVETVDVDLCALYNAYLATHKDRPSGRIILLHVAEEHALLVVADKAGPLLARQLDLGVLGLVEAVADGGRMATDEAMRSIFSQPNPAFLYNAPFSLWIKQLTDQVRGSTRSLARGGDLASEVFLSGEAAMIDRLPMQVQDAIGIPVSIFNPLRTVTVDASVTTQSPLDGTLYAVAFGLALRQLD
jgi:type IV pilus assembly protein PilM